MKLVHRTYGDIEFLEPQGDMRAGKDLEKIAKLFQSLIKEGKKKFVLNMEMVPYIDSAGLGAILRCYTSSRKTKCIFKLLKPSERVLEVFEVTRMQNLLEWYSSDEQLIKSFSSHS
jgi:anti-sigma B factor antagonist